MKDLKQNWSAATVKFVTLQDELKIERKALLTDTQNQQKAFFNQLQNWQQQHGAQIETQQQLFKSAESYYKEADAHLKGYTTIVAEHVGTIQQYAKDVKEMTEAARAVNTTKSS